MSDSIFAREVVGGGGLVRMLSLRRGVEMRGRDSMVWPLAGTAVCEGGGARKVWMRSLIDVMLRSEVERIWSHAAPEGRSISLKMATLRSG